MKNRKDFRYSSLIIVGTGTLWLAPGSCYAGTFVLEDSSNLSTFLLMLAACASLWALNVKRRWEIRRMERRLIQSLAPDPPAKEALPGAAAAGGEKVPISSDARTRQRKSCTLLLRLAWEQEGVRKSATGVCVDISEGGMGIAVDEPIPARVRVRVQFDTDGSVRYASVRYCQQRASTYFAGLCVESMTLMEIFTERGWVAATRQRAAAGARGVHY
jgi:hypothetical protein